MGPAFVRQGGAMDSKFLVLAFIAGCLFGMLWQPLQLRESAPASTAGGPPTKAAAGGGSVYHAFSPFTPLAEVEPKIRALVAGADGLPVRPTVDQCMLQYTEKAVLFGLGRYAAAGPILEEGSFCGCSTSHMALGAQQAAAEEGRAPHPMYTSDTFASGFDAPLSPNQYRRVGADSFELLRWGKRIFKLPLGLYPVAIAPTVDKEGSVLHCLYRTLYNNNLTTSVTIIAGGSEHAPFLPYRLIFTDAAHSVEEIKSNEAYWNKYLRRGYPVIVAFHDVGSSKEMQAYLQVTYKPVYSFAIDQMWVMEVPAA